MATQNKVRSELFMARAMRLFGNSVYRVALASSHSHQDAQDVAQDVFMKLLVDHTQFESDEHLKAWLLRVTVNRCHELYRKPWKQRTASLDASEHDVVSPEPSPEDVALAELEATPVWNALLRLDPKLREVALLFYVEECSTGEIAHITGAQPATVRTRLHRARKHLKNFLEPERRCDAPTKDSKPTTYKRGVNNEQTRIQRFQSEGQRSTSAG